MGGNSTLWLRPLITAAQILTEEDTAAIFGVLTDQYQVKTTLHDEDQDQDQDQACVERKQDGGHLCLQPSFSQLSLKLIGNFSDQ